MRSLRFLQLSFVIAIPILLIWSAQHAMASPDVSITGTVRSGSPLRLVSSVWVIVYQNNDVKGKSLTGNDGKYLVSGLEEGSYNVVVKRRQQDTHELYRRQVDLTRDMTFDISF